MFIFVPYKHLNYPYITVKKNTYPSTPISHTSAGCTVAVEESSWDRKTGSKDYNIRLYPNRSFPWIVSRPLEHIPAWQEHQNVSHERWMRLFARMDCLECFVAIFVFLTLKECGGVNGWLKASIDLSSLCAFAIFQDIKCRIQNINKDANNRYFRLDNFIKIFRESVIW